MMGNRWADHYTRRAQQEKWLARSVYKLQEMDRRFRLLRKGDHVLDLGCSPGSWSQYALQQVGPKGEVAGVDLSPPEQLSSPHFRFIQADALSVDMEWLIAQVKPRDVVLSDMSPQTTGNRWTDASRSMTLARRASEIALTLLKKNGHFACKVFEGDEIQHFKSEMAEHFDRIRLFRPGAVRKGSREVYLIGLKRR
jgi:23S rRNA (uridine2552-2'-O)-methyltransferase